MERRVDPQIVVGQLADRTGFTLEVGRFEGSKAEITTLLPIIQAIQDRHGINDIVVVADAGMLSAKNFAKLDEVALRFIVGSRVTKAPADLEGHFHRKSTAVTDGQIIDTITPSHPRTSGRDRARRVERAWDPGEHPKYWRVVWAYSRKRAARDRHALTAQGNRARAVIEAEEAIKSTRFVKITAAGRSVVKAALARARDPVGLRSYVTNIPATVLGPGEVISSCHDL